MKSKLKREAEVEKTEMIIDVSQNTLVCGDNLEWLKWIPDESVDLCYVDPPFFSNRNYEIIWGNGYETRSFGDRFAGGLGHYIEWMRPRLEIIQSKLKNTGHMILHCDWHANHRLRCLLEDVFGEECFCNEIYWKRQSSHNDAKGKMADIVDVLLYFKKRSATFKAVYRKHDEEYVNQFYRHDDQDGRGVYRLDNMTSPNPRPNMTYEWNGFAPPAKGWRYEKCRMQQLHKEGRIYYPKDKSGRLDRTKRPALKRYLKEMEAKGGQVVANLWDDIPPVQNSSREKMGYPTQKPEALIRRVLEFSTKEGDVVLDCFAGGGTTARVCADMKRTFICGDVSPVAVRIMAERLHRNCFQVPFQIRNLAKTDCEFKAMDGHEFAQLICELNGWSVNSRKSGDGGIDGWDGEGNPIQVKNHASTATGRPDIQKFHSAIVSAKKKRGVFVAWDFAKTAREYMAEIKREFGIEIIARPCMEILGSLVLPPEKQAEIEKLYKARMPSDWENESSALQTSRAS